MSKTIHIDVFNPASINKAIQEIEAYKKWVQAKAAMLQERVATYIASYAGPIFNNSIGDDTFKIKQGSETTPEGPRIGDVAVYVENEGNVTLVIAQGKDAVFMEFGAGVLYNGAVGSSPNPWGGDLGYTIGSYGPNGAKQTWAYKGSDGQIHLTHGTPASMPMYRATQAAINDIARIAKEVFSL